MTEWDEFRQGARERGVLACELYVAISTRAGDAEAMKALMPDHLAYQLEQEAAGTLAFAGPMSNLAGDSMGGVSMIVYRAETLEVARRIAENDPMHKSGLRTFEMRKWLVNEGSFTLEVKLSGKGVEMT